VVDICLCYNDYAMLQFLTLFQIAGESETLEVDSFDYELLERS